MKKLIAMTAIVAACGATPVMADQALATAKGCMGCHQLAAKVVGPSYNEVAAKYKGDASAKAMLVDKVINGGVGTWGQIPMPANKLMGVTEADAAKIVDWILSL